MNESVKAKKASKNGWNGWNGDTINLVGIWVIVAIFLTLGAVLMLNVVLYGQGEIGYYTSFGRTSEEWNQSALNYLETVEGYTGGVIWSETSESYAYVVERAYSVFMLPTRFVIALVFLILGIYAMPKTRRK